MKKIDKLLLEKFVASRCSNDEQLEVISWFIDNGYDISLKDAIKDEYNEILDDNRLDVDTAEIRLLLDKIHHKINIRNSRKKLRIPLKSIFSKINRVAAILFIPLLITASLYISKYYQQTHNINSGTVEIIAPAAARIHFNLPDGSSGWLNSESVLKYRAGLATAQRFVELTGEGYFEVAKDKSRPFIVKANNIEVKVLGTKFNVNGYSCNEDIEITLESGKVEVYNATHLNNKSLLGTMVPGDQFTISKTDLKKIVKRRISTPDYFSAWKDGILLFREESMVQVANKLSRWFNVEVVIQGDELKDYQYHATFREESLEEIMKLIKLTSPIDYKVVKRKKLSDGTYSKEKIVLFAKK